MKVAIVGLGNQGEKRMRVAGEDLVCAVDPFNPRAHYQTIEQVPLSEYEAALVCTPDKAKFAVVEYLLANGKHVLVEKPMLAETDPGLVRLRELSEANNVICYTAYNHRFEPHIVSVKEILASGQLGDIYLVRLFYGNGTAREAKGSWRDQGQGVLTDLGSHLLDLVLFFFGDTARNFEAWALNSFENSSYDHVHFASPGKPFLELEATMLSWRNSFSIDILGGHGSVHIEGLCKWGPSTLTIRRRKLPSGKPDEERKVFEVDDPTWGIEYEHFKERCKTLCSNLDNDIWINARLQSIESKVVGSPKV
jgi:scyllo-inositol 2-dehydrogenase (NADP+)